MRKLLDGAGEGEAVGRDDAVVAVVGLQGLFVDRLGVDDGELAGGRSEDAEVSGDADVVAEAAEAVGDHAVASLAVFERFRSCRVRWPAGGSSGRV